MSSWFSLPTTFRNTKHFTFSKKKDLHFVLIIELLSCCIASLLVILVVIQLSNLVSAGAVLSAFVISYPDEPGEPQRDALFHIHQPYGWKIK